MKTLPILAAAALLAGCSGQKTLRVCADPNNLPFSNEQQQGFENKIVGLIAKDLHRTVSYTWWPQWRGYVRKTLNARRCDLWPGVATRLDMLATTRPYYRSTYVFVTRADRNLDIKSFDDPELRKLKIGVQLVGDDAMNTPPAHALARRGIIDNVRGYLLYGSGPNPPSTIIKAVERGDIDVGVAWGPMAGYFAERSKVPLKVQPVEPWLDGPQWPMVFDISMGVRKKDVKFRRRIEQILQREQPQIRSILAQYGVPPPPPNAAAAGGRPS